MHLPLHHSHTPGNDIRQIRDAWNYPHILMAGIGTIVLCALTASIPFLIDFNHHPLRSVLLIIGTTVVDVGYVAVVLTLYRRLRARRLIVSDQGFQITDLKGDTRDVRWAEVSDLRIESSFMETRRVLASYQICLRDNSEVSVPRFRRSAGQVYLELVGGTITTGLRGLTDRLKAEGVVGIGEIEVTLAEVIVGQQHILIDHIEEIKSRMPAEPEIWVKVRESPVPLTLDLYDQRSSQTVPQAYLLPVLLRALLAARQPVTGSPPG